jgi:hypothetical protein
MEKVAPDISDARSLPPRARSARSRRLHRDLHQRLDVAIPQHRRDETAVERHREPDVRAVVLANGRALKRGIHAGVLEEGERAGTDHEVVDGDLGIAFQRVQLLPQLPGSIHAASEVT